MEAMQHPGGFTRHLQAFISDLLWHRTATSSVMDQPLSLPFPAALKPRPSHRAGKSKTEPVTKARIKDCIELQQCPAQLSSTDLLGTMHPWLLPLFLPCLAFAAQVSAALALRRMPKKHAHSSSRCCCHAENRRTAISVEVL